MFKVKKEVVKITDSSGNVETYELSPLKGKHLDLFFEVAKKADGVSEKTIDGDLMTKMHTLVVESLKISYPEQKEEDIDLFVTQNLFKFIEPLIKANLPMTE